MSLASEVLHSGLCSLLCTSVGARPLNSALEIDMDFDRSLKPPPQPTQEFTTSLEDLIKRRISDQQFDDPARREAPSAELQKQMTELDDKQSGKVGTVLPTSPPKPLHAPKQQCHSLEQSKTKVTDHPARLSSHPWLCPMQSGWKALPDGDKSPHL